MLILYISIRFTEYLTSNQTLTQEATAVTRNMRAYETRVAVELLPIPHPRDLQKQRHAVEVKQQAASDAQQASKDAIVYVSFCRWE